MDWLTALQSSTLAMALRDSAWLYLTVRVAHLLGAALMVGAIVPLDLRLLGLWRRVSPAPLGRVLRSCAAVGLIVAIVSGSLLFVVSPVRYADSDVFVGKMVLVGLGGANRSLRRAYASPSRLLSRSMARCAGNGRSPCQAAQRRLGRASRPLSGASEAPAGRRCGSCEGHVSCFTSRLRFRAQPMGQDKAQAAAKGRSLGQACNAGLAHWLGSPRA